MELRAVESAVPLRKRGAQDISEAEDDGRRQLPQPTTQLEVSPNFQPESYTIDHGSPQLSTYQTVPVNSTEFTRTVLYGMFCRLGTRKWVRMTVSLTIGIESGLWRLHQFGNSLQVKNEPPFPALRQLRQFLSSHQVVESDVNLKVYLGSHENHQIQESPPKPGNEAPDTSLCFDRWLQSTTSLLYHANCSRVPERALEQVSLPKRSKSFNFISRHESQ